jgi:NAD(P)-dependent dehydrogenase (short-subunit alcohol dehydrogenase family)
MSDISGTTAVVTGASRGFGKAIAMALTGAGAKVVGVARDQARLEALAEQLGEGFTPVVADVADPMVAGSLIDRYRPRTLVLNAGANPLARPLQRHTWESFSRNWEVDVRQAFHWLREALLLPLDPGSVVVSVSSGAALRGSPLSGGYAGAKATIRFISSYAAAESERGGLGITFTSVLPRLTPLTELGSYWVAAYAGWYGKDVETYLAEGGASLTMEQAGKEVLELAADPAGHEHEAYVLGAAGLVPVA